MTKMPPVPPAGRTPKGPDADPSTATQRQKEASGKVHPDSADKNLREQGDSGNIRQNTTHQGYQQDR